MPKGHEMTNLGELSSNRSKNVRTRILITVLLCGCLCLLGLAESDAETFACTVRGTGYYLAVSAKLQSPDLIYIFGATNLPAGSVLLVTINNFIGTRSKRLNRETKAVVGGDGLFKTSVLPIKGTEFRNNEEADIVFDPWYPKQPEIATRVVGKNGECLGDTATNPQIQDNSKTKLLVSRIAVLE